MKQGDFAPMCFDLVHLLENLGGDINCASAMNDWDFVTHIPVPCEFD